MEILPNDGIVTYRSINSTKSSASDAGNVSEPRLISQVGRVREVVFAFVGSAMGAVEMRVFVSLRGSCSHVPMVGGR
jgi:hypothetical protein